MESMKKESEENSTEKTKEKVSWITCEAVFSETVMSAHADFFTMSIFDNC